MSVLLGDLAIYWTEIRSALSASVRPETKVKQNVAGATAEAPLGMVSTGSE
jgi:hypothetical protein